MGVNIQALDTMAASLSLGHWTVVGGFLLQAALAFHLPYMGWFNIFAPTVRHVHPVQPATFGRPPAPVKIPDNFYYGTESENGVPAPGTPGGDYPIFSEAPETSFDCEG